MTAIRGFLVAAALAASPASARAQAPAGQAALPSAEPALSPGRVFAEADGAALYAQVCAACHQADGRGAVGAAVYPSLAQNAKLEQPGYPVTVLLYGLRGMPALGRMMNDGQVADVVNYVRTHFGNGYSDAVSAADVKAVRP